MFKKFKSMILGHLAEGEARFQLKTEDSIRKFRDSNETPEQKAQKNADFLAMMNPTNEQVRTAQTPKQIFAQQKLEEDEAAMFRTANIRKEINQMEDPIKDKIVLKILSEELKEKAINTIKNLRTLTKEHKPEVFKIK